MIKKRNFREESEDDNSLPYQDPKRRPIFKTDVRDDLRLNEIVLEPFIRSVVRDVVEGAVFSHFKASPSISHHRVGTSRARHLQLEFINRLHSNIYAGNNIQAEDRSPIQIILIDSTCQSRIIDGPLSSVKLEIVAINGDFGSDDWSEEEFNNKIIRKREGKRPLLTGELTVTLKEGVGCIGGLTFTDNSSWIRSSKFRLGARVVQKTSVGAKIREAISNPFRVKDHRGELNMKNHPPSLDDETWRLERIAKDGKCHKRLVSLNIKTVKDFLQWYMRDQSTLRSVLKINHDKKWKVITEHALECVINNNEFYGYDKEPKIILWFNSIYKVVGASFAGYYYSIHQLNPIQKMKVETLKMNAYKNVNDLIPIDEMPTSQWIQRCPQDETSNNGLQIVHQDQPMVQPNVNLWYNQVSTPSYPLEEENDHELVTSIAQNNNLNPTATTKFIMEEFFVANGNAESNYCTSSSQGPTVPNGNFLPTTNFHQVQTSPFFPITPT